MCIKKRNVKLKQDNFIQIDFQNIDYPSYVGSFFLEI